QVAVDHAFTGTYIQRFRPSTGNPPENASCPCGEPIRTAAHVLLHCPRFIRPRTTHALLSILSMAFAPIHPIYPHTRLFSTRDGAKKLCKFLQDT
ncbi:hypothetical protein EDB86DRAFT_2749587, partial [Lactarius hatsudake]